MEKVFERIRKEAEQAMARTSHAFDHVERVYNMCMHLAEGEQVDLDVLKAAAWLHDIARNEEDADSSGETDHALLGGKKAEKILKEVGFPAEKIERVQECIRTHRFRSDRKPESIEAKILFDADKLDALGAVGVARGYVWTGENGAQIYRPCVNIEEYIKENLGGKKNGIIQDKTKHTAHIEFETKHKHVKDRMFTQKGKAIAEERIAYYKSFLDRMEQEIKGEL